MTDARSLVAAVIVVLLIISVLIPGIAVGQPTAAAPQLASPPLNKFIEAWPVVAIVVLAAVLVAGLLGVFDLGTANLVLLLAAIAFLVYEFYWRPLSHSFPH